MASTGAGGSDFATDQRQRYLFEINRAVPSRQTALDATTVEAALSTADSVASQPIAVRQVIERVGDGTGASRALAQDAACRAIPYPGPAMRDPAARTGCGWWFVADPTTPSVGAYGTRRGPMHPTLDREVGPGEWIWDPEEARSREAQKQSARIRTCPDIQFSPMPGMGWCTDSGRAIMTDGAGNPLYPRAPGGDCAAGSIVTNAANCPTTPPASSAGGRAPITGTASLCSPGANGALSPACLESLTTWGGCSTQGVLAQSLSHGSSYAGASAPFQSAHSVLQQRGFSLHSGIVQDGKLSVQAALSSIGGLRQQATTGDGSRAAHAAANLCYGAPFDPCQGLQTTDKAPHSSVCIDRELDKAGYAPNGNLRPAKIGMDYWNKEVGGTWQTVLDNISWWKSTADTDVADPKLQSGAIQNVYGVGIKFPRSGCNTQGTEILRYALQNGDVSMFGFFPTNPQTHFLGRVLQGAGYGGVGIMSNGAAGEMIPGTGAAAEGNRHIAIFRPSTGGPTQFMITYDDAYQLTLIDSAGTMILQKSGNLLMGAARTHTTPIVNLIAGQEYKMIFDFWNIIGNTWAKNVTISMSGGAWSPLPLDQFYLPADRRLPLLELAFHKMRTGTKGAIQDTNNLIQNWSIPEWGPGVIGTVAGQPCLVVAGSGAYCGNFNKYCQGMRLRALRSFTMKLYVKSGSISWPRGYTPSFFAMYNLPSTNTAGPLRLGAPQDSWNWPNRTADFNITSNGTTIYPYGTQKRGGGDMTTSIFHNNWSNGGASILPLNRWFHFAFVWADDFTSYAMYMDGKLVANVTSAVYDPDLIMESIRIGCDGTDDMAQWAGGVAWFRGFDYRLSGDLIQRDMNDDWAGLI
jgi:hypothetical protein